MPICSYVVVPRTGQKEALRRALSGLPGCEVIPAENAELLLLVTSAASPGADTDLRRRVEALPGIQALLLTFGEVDAETLGADSLEASAGGTPGESRARPTEGRSKGT